ncbi:uncharacterized protein SCHCODRAFT_02520456 [Schizophyllum commune H4-8]|nr:uncharacterized protein SCHCODRAFT_02520456 [Schizophyllum commune H4-8]KAI5885307.1 hypothetical protein SCHCODRAFT_02520456 [Schizophyllum commune H4-8]
MWRRKYDLPHAQSSTCRHAITATDLVGCHEHSGDVAPAEERSRSSQRVSAVSPQFGSDACLLGGAETVSRRLEDCAALACAIAVLLLTGDLQHAQSAQAPHNLPAVCQRHTEHCGVAPFARERERGDAQGALAGALPLWTQSLPKREGLPLTRTAVSTSGTAALRPSVLVATCQASEHSIDHTLLLASARPAQSPQFKRLQRAADIHAQTDTQRLEAFFRRPATVIRPLPTCSGADLRADRTLASYPTRGEVHKAGGGEVGRQSSMLFRILSPSTASTASSSTAGLPAAVCYQVRPAWRRRWYIDLPTPFVSVLTSIPSMRIYCYFPQDIVCLIASANVGLRARVLPRRRARAQLFDFDIALAVQTRPRLLPRRQAHSPLAFKLVLAFNRRLALQRIFNLEHIPTLAFKPNLLVLKLNLTPTTPTR